MKNQSQRKSILAIVMAIIFILAQLFISMPLLFAHKVNTVSASEVEHKEYLEPVTITNGSFVDTTGTSYPRTPTNWTEQKISDDQKAKAGVIDVSPTIFDKNKKDYGLTVNPESASNKDNSILMINSEDNSIRYGYKSSAITLSQDSFYEISFRAKSDATNNNGFSAYLISENIENTALNSFINIQNGAWVKYTFYIKTGASSESVNLELWAGAKNSNQSMKGAVFFDDIKATKYTETAYQNQNTSSLNAKEINLQNQLQNVITNASFEDGLEGFTRLTTGDENTSISSTTSLSAIGFDKNTTKIDNAPSTNMIKARDNTLTMVDNKKGLFINNLQESSTGYKTTSFDVKRFETLAVSIYVKTGKVSSNGASLILTQVEEEVAEGEEKPELYKTSFTSINTSDYKNSFTNDWAMYTFYVQGNPFNDTTLELQMWLGEKDKTTKGYAFFDEIRVTSISSNQYNDASDSTYSKKLSLQNLEALDIKNGAFNLITNGDKVDGVYNPSDWTLTTNSKTDGKYSGIINTKKAYFDAYKENYHLSTNPGVIPNQFNHLDETQVSNNILMIHNASNGDQTFTSSEYSLEADKTYKITFDAKVAQANQLAEVTILNKDNIVAKFQIQNTDWTKYTVNIKNGKDSQTIKVALSLGTKEAPIFGHAFFDNFESKTIEDDIYKMTQNKENKLVDLVDENFLTTGDQKNEVYAPYLWTGKNNSAQDSSIIAGILDADNTVLPFEIKNNKAKTNNSLVIYSTNDTHYTFTSKRNYTFKSSSYYKVEIDYMLNNISQDDINKKTDKDKKDIPFGAFISLDGLNIKSNALTETQNGYQTYTFYIKTKDSETTSPISIELGAMDALTKGGISVSSIKVNESTKDAFNEISESLDKVAGMKVDLSGNADSDEEDEKAPSTGPNLQLVDIAGIIIVVALVIAIIGTIIKQVLKRKKKVTTTVGKYDRTYSSKETKNVDKVEARLEEVEAELIRLNETITALTNAQNELIARREATEDSIEAEKLLKQIDKISNELAYENDNKDSVEKERTILKNRLNK